MDYVPSCCRYRYTVRLKPQKLALNCNSSLVAVIDSTGVLTVQDLEAKVSECQHACTSASTPARLELTCWEGLPAFLTGTISVRLRFSQS